jgi:hypothetical protein
MRIPGARPRIPYGYFPETLAIGDTLDFGDLTGSLSQRSQACPLNINVMEEAGDEKVCLHGLRLYL